MSYENKDYSFVFSKNTSTEWVKNEEYCDDYLETLRHWSNERVKARGYLLLNDLFYELGLKPDYNLKCVGWVVYKKDILILNPIKFNITKLNKDDDIEYLIKVNCCEDVFDTLLEDSEDDSRKELKDALEKKHKEVIKLNREIRYLESIFKGERR